jgi:hypothetical protein
VHGVETCCSSNHARKATALHHGQLAVHIGVAGGTLVPCLGDCGVGGFGEELHGTGTEPPQGFKRDRAVRISRTGMAGKLILAHVCAPKSSCMTRGAGGEMKVISS